MTNPSTFSFSFEAALTRRSVLRGAAFAAAALAFPSSARFARAAGLSADAKSAIETSPLVYVCPLRSNGAESTCHGEVWFVADGDDVLVVTAADRWKAVAIEKGLDQARLWVGDHGVWKRSDKWKQAPSYDATATFDTDPKARARALAAFGAKYPEEWDKWGPRFRNGLEDKSRVLIRYSPKAG